MAQRPQILAAERQYRRLVALKRERPAFRGLDRISRAIDLELRHRSEALQMLDRLVRRSVFAKADRIMGHDIDDPSPLQRREANRGRA